MAIRLSSENKGSVNMELSKTALAARYAQEAKTASESAQAAAVHPPVIGGNGNWQIWNQGSGAYVDSGICAKGPAGEQGPRGEAGNYTKPAAGIPEEDLSQAVRNKLNSGGASNYADLNNKPGINGVTLSGNKTAAQLGLAAADDVPTKTSQLQNDVGFLAQHQSLAAYRTAAAQDVIDANLMALGLSGASVGDLVRVASVDTNGKPTSWRKAPLCEITTNPNLLDNWYFIYGKAINNDYSSNGTFPVNQRGQQSYNNGYTYGIDRWFHTSGMSISSDGNGLTIPSGCWFLQRLEESLINSLMGKTVTLSLLDSNDVLYTGSGVFSSSEIRVTTPIGNIYLSYASAETAKYRFLFVSSVNVTIKAAKLELGSEQTLAHQENGQWVLNEIPDYGEELAKCQRYLYRWNGFYFVPTFSNSECYGSIAHPVKMAGTPSITNVTYNTGWGVPDVNTVNEYQVVFHNFSTSPIILSYDAAISNLGG